MASTKKPEPDKADAAESTISPNDVLNEPLLLTPSTPPAAPVQKTAPKPPTTPVTPHHTVCRVVGTIVVSGGRSFQPDEVAEFPNSDVASLPEYLVPIES